MESSSGSISSSDDNNDLISIESWSEDESSLDERRKLLRSRVVSSSSMLKTRGISSVNLTALDYSNIKRMLGANSLPVVNDTWCKEAFCSFFVAFSFWVESDRMTSHDIASSLLERQVYVQGSWTQLWETMGMPGEVKELSRHFRQLLGDEYDSSTVRLRLSEKALTLFSRAFLRIPSAEGTVAMIPCEWTEVSLVVFPHGAILSVTVDWVRGNDSLISFGDWRIRTYVAKFSSERVGICDGWGFANQEPLLIPALVEEAKNVFGLNLYGALYQGTGISLSSLANWLVKLSGEPSSAIVCRISPHEMCQYHAFVRVQGPLNPKKVSSLGLSELSQMAQVSYF